MPGVGELRGDIQGEGQQLQSPAGRVERVKETGEIRRSVGQIAILV